MYTTDLTWSHLGLNLKLCYEKPQLYTDAVRGILRVIMGFLVPPVPRPDVKQVQCDQCGFSVLVFLISIKCEVT
jgi:hypothetical protein